MILANFDLSFFTSIPGLLITGGVLLLLIALIIFIATGSKKEDKKEDVTVAVENKEVNEQAAAPLNVSSTVTPVSQPNTNTLENNTAATSSVVVETPKEVNEPVNNTISVTPSLVGENTVSQVNTANDVVNPTQPVTNNVNIVPNVSPKVMGTSLPPKSEEVKAPEVSPSMPVSNPTDVSSAPAVTIVNDDVNPNEEKPVEDSKPIYGGVSSVIPKINVVGEQHRPIYGGADPLENTGALPKVNNTEAAVVTPKIEVKPEVKPEVVKSEPVVSTPQSNQFNQSNQSNQINQKETTPTVTVQPTQSVQPSQQPKEEEIESLF